jgi:predicted nucleic acid-binding protein
VEYNFCMQVSTRDDVVTKIKANRRALKRYSVRSLALFGSAARNKMRKSSDIDVLVQFDKTTWAGSGFSHAKGAQTCDKTLHRKRLALCRLVMLIYLDTNLILYFADYSDFIFGDCNNVSKIESNLLKELMSLRKIVEIEQFGEGWNAAVSSHLLGELSKNLKPRQEETIEILVDSWKEIGWLAANNANEEDVSSIDRSLISLNLRPADRQHLAEAVALGATWFLTNDKRLIKRTRPKKFPNKVRNVSGVFVAKPSECIEEISRGLFLK